MADILQLRRDVVGSRTGYTVADGELFVDTSVHQLFVGDGTIVGGALVGAPTVVVTAAGSLGIGSTDVGKCFVFNGTGTAVTVTQPANTPGAGNITNRSAFELINIGSGAVTVTPTSSTINGASVLNIPVGGSAIVYCDGTNYYAVTSGASGSGGGIVMVSKTTNYTLVSSDNGTHFDNIGAIVGITFTMLAAVRGFSAAFLVDAAHSVAVAAGGTDVIRYGGNVTAGGGNIASSTVGAYLALESHQAGEWVAMSFLGDWA